MRKYILWFVFFGLFHGFSQKISSDTKISILTIGKGNELHSLFGHTALRLKDQRNGLDIVYNFGYFDFDTPNFYLKFIKGDLLYHAEIEQYSQLISYYNYLSRDVKEQELDLNLNQKQELINQLNGIILSNQRFYIYKFIDDNCTTRVQKVVAKILLKDIEKVKDTTLSYRKIINNYLGDRYFEKLGINIIFGMRVDENAKQLFLPNELFESLEKKEFKKSNQTILTFNTNHPAPWWNSFWLMLFFLASVFLINKKWIYSALLIILGLLGLFFMSIGFYSLHQEVLWNYNVLLFNPILLFIVLSKNKTLVKKLSLTFYLLVLIYFIYLLNKDHFLMMLPFLFFMPLYVWRLLKQK